MNIIKLTINMRVMLRDDPLAGLFSKQLLNIGKVTVSTDQNNRAINLLNVFCNIMDTKESFLKNVFSNICENVHDQ